MGKYLFDAFIFENSQRDEGYLSSLLFGFIIYIRKVK
jgi:hypothetical protein